MSAPSASWENTLALEVEEIDLFTDTVAILISIVSKDIMGNYVERLRGQINVYLSPGHPITAIRNNRNQNGRRIGKKVYYRR